MVYFPLSSDPNQSFEVSPEGITYRFHLRYLRGLMYCTIESVEGIRIAGPVRVCNTEWLITHPAYNLEGMGNFMILDREGQYPDFSRFNSSCELRYYTHDEVAEIEGR